MCHNGSQIWLGTNLSASAAYSLNNNTLLLIEYTRGWRPKMTMNSI